MVGLIAAFGVFSRDNPTPQKRSSFTRKPHMPTDCRNSRCAIVGAHCAFRWRLVAELVAEVRRTRLPRPRRTICPPYVVRFVMADSLIARELLFGNPKRRYPSISPDSRFLAWIAPDPRHVPQIWVQTLGANDARMVTADSRRGLSLYAWSHDSRTIIYFQDADGDENFHAFALSLERGETRDLTPWPSARCGAIGMNPRFPDQICFSVNRRDRRLMDVYRVNIHTGAASWTPSIPAT